MYPVAGIFARVCHSYNCNLKTETFKTMDCEAQLVFDFREQGFILEILDHDFRQNTC